MTVAGLERGGSAVYAINENRKKKLTTVAADRAFIGIRKSGRWIQMKAAARIENEGCCFASTIYNDNGAERGLCS